MDPLSITASILTLAAAGGSLTSTLHRLRALKDAPDDLLDLSAELEYIHLLASVIQNICRQRDDRLSASDGYDQLMYLSLKRSEHDVLRVEKLIAYDLTKVTSDGAKLDKVAWLRAQSKVQKAKERLRNTTNMLTGILNA